MIAVVQRVTSAQVSIDAAIISSIKKGYLIFLGVCDSDMETDAMKLAQKIFSLRIMADDQDKMNKSLQDVGGEALVVSQFTLCANLSGRRPSFASAKNPLDAQELYNLFNKQLQALGIDVKTGQFGAKMSVLLVNDGPVTFILDSKTL